MRYSRMMNNHPIKKKGKLTNLFIVLIVLGIAAYFVCAGAAGSWIANNIINPVFNNGAASAATDSQESNTVTQIPESNSASSTPSPGASGTRAEEEVTANEISLYTLQAGAYSSESNANVAAAQIKSQGGAGYIAYDGNLYRVLIAGYTDENDANDVKTSLYQQNIDAALFNLKTGALSFKIGAEQSQIDAVKACFESVPATVNSLQQIIFDYDKGLSVDNSIQALKQNVADIFKDFSNKVLSDEASIKKLRSYMESYSDTIESLPSSSSVTASEFSASLRYSLISIVIDYSSFLDDLNG